MTHPHGSPNVYGDTPVTAYGPVGVHADGAGGSSANGVRGSAAATGVSVTPIPNDDDAPGIGTA